MKCRPSPLYLLQEEIKDLLVPIDARGTAVSIREVDGGVCMMGAVEKEASGGALGGAGGRAAAA